MSTAAFADWVSRARARDILEEAVSRGAVLKRAGREHVGPCPVCQGTDRFSVNPAKRIFNCRGAEGGDVIAMVQHLDGVSFTQACEALTGEPPPGRESKPLSEVQKAARVKALADAKARERAQKEAQEAYEQDTTAAALAIWNASIGIGGTPAESYLRSRGLGAPGVMLEPVLRFHPGLPYPGMTGKFPAMVCRVDDVAGEFTGVWRVFLRPDGSGKLDCAAPKLGLGPAAGGAVRLGGIGPKLGIAEGVETALGAWLLTGRKYPVWASLSTAGMIRFELPPDAKQLVIYPDGDRPMRRNGDEYVSAVPAGRKAAQALLARMKQDGARCTLAAEPPAKRDYLDLWNAQTREAAE